MATLSTQVEGSKSGDSQSSPQPTAGKRYYTVFPKNGTDVSKTADFIKALVGAEDLLPWSDVDDQLMHWTVEASPDQASQLQVHTDIDHITEFDPPAPPAATRSIRDPHWERVAKRDDALASSFLVFPIDGKNQAQTDQTEQYLQNLVGKENVRPPFIFDGVIRYWRCNMTTTQQLAAAKNPGVKAVEVNRKGTLGRHQPVPLDPLPLLSLAGKFSNFKAKRALAYSSQINAVTELVEISQPSTIPDLTKLKNYVFESNNGRNSFVYHIEGGVAYKMQANEFPNVVPDGQHLQTDIAKSNGINPWEDPLGNSHGTCTAGKAVGKSYGAAKQAKLVVVQIWDLDMDEVVQALNLIIQDINAKPERKKKSVITFSIYFEQYSFDPNVEAIFYDVLKRVLDMDIPMFVCAGNEAHDPKRKNVDTLPSLWAAPDFPLVVVGSTDHGGAPSDFSQGGPQVTLHAPGNQITCMLKGSAPGSPATEVWGTSFATPLVAGEAANLLSYDTVPFDTSDGHLVKNLKNYLQTDAASWARTPNIRVIWNGVTQRDNPSITLVPQPTIQPTTIPAPAPTPQLTCSGLASKKYVDRDGLVNHIKKEFCPDVVKQGGPDKGSGSIVRRYNQGTPDEVSIAIDLSSRTSIPNEGDCETQLLNINSGCDGNDPKNNPANYTGGGLFTDGGNKYHVDPQALRQPAFGGLGMGCESSYKVLYNEYTVWGAGWDCADFGDGFRTQLKGCALLPNTWSFSYGLGSDGREWTAKFRTGVFQKGCVDNAGKTASGIGNFGCSGRG